MICFRILEHVFGTLRSDLRAIVVLHYFWNVYHTFFKEHVDSNMQQVHKRNRKHSKDISAKMDFDYLERVKHWKQGKHR